jgi:hypothetical protein
MAKYGSSVVTVTLDDAPGGTPRIITPYVNTIGGIGIELLTQQTNPFGTAFESHTATGMEKTADIPMTGFFDDTATLGPKVMFFSNTTKNLDKAPGSVGRVLVILAATSHTFTITVHVVKAEIIAKNGNLTEYAVLLRQKSAGVWS